MSSTVQARNASLRERALRRVGRVGGVLAAGATLLLAGCDFDVSSSGAEIVPRFTFTVNITNDGDGSGSVDVAFSGGTVTVSNPCPEILGPGESCSPRATSAAAVEQVEIDVVPAGASDFGGWTEGPCPAMETECTITNQTRDFDVEVDLTLLFEAPSG